MPNQTYELELNFLQEFNLSRNGMIKELKTEFDIIRLCISQRDELGESYFTMIDRIMVMPLRKLLCEKNSILQKLCPDFKMTPLEGKTIELEDKLSVILPPFKTKSQDQWILLKDWLNTNIAWIDKTSADIPYGFSESLKNDILKNLKNNDKSEFESFLTEEDKEYKGQQIRVFKTIGSDDRIFELLKKAGYYDLSVFRFIKHFSDKRGAHIDFSYAPTVMLINGKNQQFNAIFCICAQMIYAAKKQIPEMADYWPEMPDLTERVE